MRSIFVFAFFALVLAACSQPPATIRHSVAFKTKHPRGSAAEADFLAAARSLNSIKTVRNFRFYEEISPKNPFDYALSMDFTNQAAYDFYNQHPDHVRFVKQRWLKEVTDFQEYDYQLR